MTPFSMLLLSGLAIGVGSVSEGPAARLAPEQWTMPGKAEGRDFRLAQATIEQRVIIRVPLMRRPPPPPRENEEWEERKGPKCIDLKRLRAAAVTSPRGVDLMLSGRERIRALLGRECRPADLYSGLYIQPNEDGALCAGRDRVLSRSGADCPIRKLVRMVREESE